jgi:hypothetical protein
MNRKKRGKGGGLTFRSSLFIAAISSFLMGLYFISFTLTGNAIGNVNSLDFSIMGAILFWSGLIAGFFWLKNK